MRAIGLDFEVIEPETDFAPGCSEAVDESSAVSFALDTARRKGDKYAQRYPQAIVISADTIVYADGRIYGKPSSREDARQALRSLYNRTHLVVTALALHYAGQCYCGYERTEVTFDGLSEEEEDIYVEKAEIMDKAGSYAIQGVGGVLVRKIDGDFYNVVGIPLNLLDRLFREAGLPGLLSIIK